MASLLKKKNLIKIPSKGYQDLRDVAKGIHPSVLEWEGNECPFQDVLHHNRYNLEELLQPHHEYVPELLDLIKLEQAEQGENSKELQDHIIKRALSKPGCNMTMMVEEIQSIVLEIGSATTRVGYSGDDCPQTIFPTIVSSTGQMGVSALSLEYTQPVSQTGQADANYLEQIISASFDRLKVSPQDFPLMYIDGPLLEGSDRKAIVELLFEKFQVPAVYLGKTPVMAMFAMGRHTGLVLESGASGSTVVPVFEGIPLNSGIVSSPIGGNYLDNICNDSLIADLPAYEHLLIPHGNIKDRKPVGLNEHPQYSLAEHLQMTDSYKKIARQTILRDFKESVVQVAESSSVTEKDLALRPPKYFEFPCGFNKNFGASRFKVGELLFSGDDSGNLGVIGLIKDSLQKLAEKNDGHAHHPQYQHHITSTLVVSGGSTLTSGFMERLNLDLQTKLPLMGKMRVQAAATSMERKLSPWIGGSILASLGTMQSFWLTKAEYSEQGPSVLLKKFP